MSILILMRHGQSQWNLANRFTGWVDVPLTPKGIEEALAGGRQIREIPIDVVYTSTLARAQMTAYLALADHSAGKVPVVQHPDGSKVRDWGAIHDEGAAAAALPVHVAWELNERWYGDLQGLDKDATREKYGEEQVHIWRRSFDTPPPNGESLEMTAARTLPYFRERIVPALAAGQNVFVSAHGNSLRSIVMELDGLGHDEVTKLEIPTGQPWLYDYADGAFTARPRG